MSDGVAPGADSRSREAGPAAFVSAGATLRKAREQAGLHIGALAVSLKVPVKKLEALETDQLDQLPDPVFARALASSVCRALKLDPGPVLRMLPEQAMPRLPVEKSIGSGSFDRPGMGWRVPFLSRLPRPVLISAGVLLLAALVMLFLPSLETMGSAGAPAAVVPGGDAPGHAAYPAHIRRPVDRPNRRGCNPSQRRSSSTWVSPRSRTWASSRQPFSDASARRTHDFTVPSGCFRCVATSACVNPS